MEGTVVRMIADKGFGFIRGEDDQEYFFHRSELNGFWDDLVKDYQSGRKITVTFNIVESQRGPRAGNVSRIDSGV